MRKKTNLLIFVFCIFFLVGHIVFAAEEKNAADESAKPQGPPPALVEVAKVIKGEAEPMVEFVGTVYYARKSNVAAEIEGIVREVFFEEGERIKRGDTLVSLESNISDTAISGTRADYELVLVELEQAEKELKKREPLYKEGSVSESSYDEYFFKSKILKNRALSIKSFLDRLLLEKGKKEIRAPFDAVVMQKNAEMGEWIQEGGVVALVADESAVDIVVNVPAGMLKYLQPGEKISIKSDSEKFTGKFLNFVPNGDVATRTFDVKIRMQNSAGLIEGMEARALIPSAAKMEGLKVPRDAVIDKFGQNVIWLAKDATAKMVPVQVIGYDGMYVGVAGTDLAEGDMVVVKGNERLREGQPVHIGNTL